MAKQQNIARRQYRRTKTTEKLHNYLYFKKLFLEERAYFLNEKYQRKIEYISQGNNIWKLVHSTFHPYSPAFKGLTTTTAIITDHQTIANMLADHYENYFKTPEIDLKNDFHKDQVSKYEEILNQSKIPLDNISLNEVERNWKKSKKKKFTDNDDLSAFLLHELPKEYQQLLTVAFNKIAQNGSVLLSSKHAKVICLSKDGLYPSVNKMRPISLLSNIGKVFE